MVFCRDIPAAEEQQVAECCAAHVDAKQRFAAAMQQTRDVPRPDLEAHNSGYDWQFKKCTKMRYAEVPVFSRNDFGETRVGGWGRGCSFQGAA